MIVVVGFATGLAILVALRLVAELHVSVPIPKPLRVVELPEQIEASAPALAVGNELTLTTTTSEAVQPELLIVSVYVVVVVGLAIVPDIFVALKPTDNPHV